MPQTFLEWNDALASRVFRPEMAGKQVFLFVNHDLIQEIGGIGSVRDFVTSVETGPPWVDGRLGLCQKALRTLDGWRDRGLAYPPYIAYLGLFVLAAGVEGPFPSHAYYSRLRTLLEWPNIDAGAPPSFDRMLGLWEDLEVWSDRDKVGALGVFSIRFGGEWIHVGLPKAQAVLTEQERRALPEIFAAASLDSTAAPSDAEFIRALRRHGAHLLRSQTLELLGNTGSEVDLSAALLDILRGELEEWDGEVGGLEQGTTLATTALVRVCIRVDAVAERVTATLRLAAKAEFPEDGLMLESPEGLRCFSCVEYLPGWSSSFRHAATGQEVDASEFDWSESLVLADNNAGWRVRLPAVRVRIFVSGLPFDLPAFIEMRGLPRNRPFFLAASDGAVPALTAWNQSGEVQLREICIRAGLPEGWRLFQSSGATSDRSVRSALPELALPGSVRLLLRGGIRNGQGNTFFNFASPTVVVEGGSGEEEILCEGRRLRPFKEASFLLPFNLPSGSQITLKVRVGDEVIRRQSLFLSDQFEWNLKAPLCTADEFGKVEPLQEGQTGIVNRISGAACGAGSEEGFEVRPELPSGKRVFIIGRRVGEIGSWPAESLPTEWEPIWLVDLARRGRAEYCGLDLRTATPIAEKAGSAYDVALWQEILWHRRKRIEQPRHPRLRQLWREYMDVASRV